MQGDQTSSSGCCVSRQFEALRLAGTFSTTLARGKYTNVLNYL